MDNEMTIVAMQMILHAGDARSNVADALRDIKAFNFEAAKEKMAEAEKQLTEAHQAQTNVLQEEANGVKHELHVLFIHAQDTLMTIKSEYELARQLIEIFESIDGRLKKVGA
ncbi:PTS lactose/cellobiose transporter subunit IIA [Allobaculum stercoricanis]|uniref:PTS lactose/cellobiose transporter subunit IIA n=1 Tax=Allobaculum stercoricanis TaxID=174709 RepID=UPI002942DA12|nr:PTS lactose/cellobiose transporter subunit IIA [Allobaculum stercoricanis]